MGFCVEALDEALTRHGQPEIFNTDQGSQFTGFAFTGRLQAAGVRISMDGRLLVVLQRRAEYCADVIDDPGIDGTKANGHKFPGIADQMNMVSRLLSFADSHRA